MPVEEGDRVTSTAAHLSASTLSTTTSGTTTTTSGGSDNKAPTGSNTDYSRLTSTSTNFGAPPYPPIPAPRHSKNKLSAGAGGDLSVRSFLIDEDPVSGGDDEDDEDEEDFNGSKLELELQFDNVRLEEGEGDEDDDDDGGPGGGGGGGGRLPPPPHPVPAEEPEAPPKPLLPEEPVEPTLAEKCLFYITAFFILLAVFSLLAFLFLVPFVIDPAFTTIFMKFDPEPALCETVSRTELEGLSNCSAPMNGWTSCREGCTREVFVCTQIWVSYRKTDKLSETSGVRWSEPPTPSLISNSKSKLHNGRTKRSRDYTLFEERFEFVDSRPSSSSTPSVGESVIIRGVERRRTSFTDILPSSNTLEDAEEVVDSDTVYERTKPTDEDEEDVLLTRRTRASGSNVNGGGRKSSKKWLFEGAHLYPNVKGCGYPPIVICSEFLEFYGEVGRNFSCFYSQVDPSLVVTTYDMNRIILDLVYSLAIPIPSFIISCVYLTFAYFKIYNLGGSPFGNGGDESNLTANPATSTNNNIGGGGGGGPDGGSGGDEHETDLCSIDDENTHILRRGSSTRGLNAIGDRLLLPNSSNKPYSQVIEMNDLGPPPPPAAGSGQFLPPLLPPPLLPDGDLRGRRPPERNGPNNNNPPAKNKGGEPTLLGGFEETDF